MATLLYQGHGSFRITTNDGLVIYVDPYAGEGYDAPADIVLITHQHGDHNRLDLLKRAPQSRVITEAEALAGGKHNTFTERGITIEAVEASNKNHDPSACVGYIITADGKTIYASGDTSTTAQMASFNERGLDWALLCCDGVYNMGVEEASACARLIGAKYNVPIHMKPGALFDRVCAERFDAPGRVIVEAGGTIEL